MKKYFYYLCVALTGMVFLNSCDEDDDIRFSDVPQAVVNTFNVMFPDVERAEWEKSRGYYVAECWYQQVETQAWFKKDGTWSMTESDLRTSLTNLPESVQTAFNASKYATWRVDDIDKFERPTDTFYLIEVETNGKRDRDLFFSPDGTLLLDEVDKDGRTVTPDKTF